MKKNIFLLIVLSTMLQAQKTGWLIFRKPQSTKPQSITVVASDMDDLSGVFYNPSILGVITHRELFMITEPVGTANDMFGGLLFGLPLNRSGLAIGTLYYDAGRGTIYFIENGQETSKEITVQRDVLALLSYGRIISKSVIFGATIKYANSNIAEVKSASAFGLDVGSIILPTENLILSFVTQNIGLATKFLEKSESLPTSLWFGAAYQLKLFKNTSLNFGTEIPYILLENRFIPSLGVEFCYGGFLGVNFGYRFGVKDSFLHIGFTANFKNINLGYSFIPAEFLSSTHRISIGWKF